MGSRRFLIGLASLGLFAVSTSCRAEFGSFGGAGSVGSNTGGSDQDPDGGGVVTGGAGGGGEAGASTEDCTSGEDEDVDGFVDCEDLGDCGDHLCAPIHDSSNAWEGPLVLHAAGVTACGPGTQVWRAEAALLTNEAAVCGCSCGAATGQLCKATVAIDCDLLNTITIDANECAPSAASANAMSAPSRPAGGSCAATDAATAPAYETVLVCSAPPGGGCVDGEICVRPLASTSGSICFARAGLHVCEGLRYAERHVVFDAPEASVGCAGTCACGAPSGGDCSGVVTLHGNAQCTNPLLIVDETCDAFGTVVSFNGLAYSADAVVTTPGLCAPLPRALDVTAGVTTFCCGAL